MALLSLRSLKGGRPIRNWALWRVKTPKFTFDPTEDKLYPEVVQDVYGYHLGYCGNCNERLFAPLSVVKHLYRLLKSEL